MLKSGMTNQDTQTIWPRQGALKDLLAKYSDRLLPETPRTKNEERFLESMYETMLEQGLLSEKDLEHIEGQTSKDFHYRTLDAYVGSRIDGLSHLPNKQFFDKYMQKMLDDVCTHHNQYEGEGIDVAVLFSDLNGFKQVNDTYGHAIGDEVLKHVSNVWGGVVRKGFTLVDVFSQSEHRHENHLDNKALLGRDFLSRWAGDEFAVIIPYPKNNIDLEAIKMRFLTALKNNPFKTEVNGEVLKIPLQASIGSLSVVEYAKQYSDVKGTEPQKMTAEEIEVLNSEIFDLVDEKMYEHKRAIKGINYCPDNWVGYIGTRWDDVSGYQSAEQANSDAPACEYDERSVLTYSVVYQPK